MLRTPPRFASCLVLASLAGCGAPAPAATPSAAGSSVPAASAPNASAPNASAATRHVIYLHGRIVETDGTNAVSPEHGRYEYDAIVRALGNDSTTVHAGVRPAGAGVAAYADSTLAQVRKLMGAGVPAERITVVGASKGGVIALMAATRLSEPEVGYVVLGACYPDLEKDFKPRLHGRVLSIYEASDSMGGSCAATFDASPALAARAEVRLETGLRHGFLFHPLPAWLEPAREWITSHRREGAQ